MIFKIHGEVNIPRGTKKIDTIILPKSNTRSDTMSISQDFKRFKKPGLIHFKGITDKMNVLQDTDKSNKIDIRQDKDISDKKNFSQEKNNLADEKSRIFQNILDERNIYNERNGFNESNSESRNDRNAQTAVKDFPARNLPSWNIQHSILKNFDQKDKRTNFEKLPRRENSKLRTEMKHTDRIGHMRKYSYFDKSFNTSSMNSDQPMSSTNWYYKEIPVYSKENSIFDMTNYHIELINNSRLSFEEQFGPFERIFDIKNFNKEKIFIDPRKILDDFSDVDRDIVYHKPPFSYSELIIEALENVKDKKMTLSQIYNFIKDKYPYYKMCNNVWQNSIRHNLSLNKRFIKMKRPKGMPGKGGFWVLDSITNTQEAIQKINKASFDQDSSNFYERKNNISLDDNLP